MRTEIAGPGYSSRAQRTFTLTGRILDALHIDGSLLLALLAVCVAGLVVLFSAAGENFSIFIGQAARVGLGLGVMTAVAQIPPRVMRMAAPFLYTIGVLLLVAVAVVGDVAMGAQRWLDLGFVRFQPSELLKIAVPLACAWYLHERPLPPDFTTLVIVVTAVALPALLIAEQPDLGTALLVTAGGGLVILLAGLQLRYIFGLGALLVAAVPAAWHFMHDYQRQRVLTFLNPQNDPLGAGYHTIQSQIAIGSGGIFGKGYMNGSQAQLEFLPERSTDFIFAVIGEEWGIVGCFVLMMLYMLVIGRGLYIASAGAGHLLAPDRGQPHAYVRRVCVRQQWHGGGLLPVVGVPLPLVSYGGTSLVTLMAGFGILMSIHSRRKLVST